jgi:ATP-dependent RNA helicase RhlE
MSATALSQFGALGVSERLVEALSRAGLNEPTPIQTQAIPPGLEGRDVLGCAQTGTGKTAAFVIPMIERLAAGPKGHPRGLILAPTRELAFQIQGTVDKLGRSLGIYSTTVVGGADMQAQVRGLRQRPDIIIATPGRLLDHMWQGTILFTKLSIVVLDEADRMLDMGFAPQLNQIIEALPDVRQTLLFSATMPDNLDDLARMSLKDPVKALVAKSATPAEGVTHTVHHTSNSEKTSLLVSILKDTEGSVLIFTRTKHRADRIGETLEKVGCSVAVLHSGRRLPQRRAALEGFRRGRFEVLVATDIAARGLDVDNIRHVINYDLPTVPEDYVHRIGRTARMKATGWATSFVTGDDNRSLRMIEKLLGKAVPCAPGSRAPSVSHAASRAPRSGYGNTNAPRGPRPGLANSNGPRGPQSDRPGRNPSGGRPRSTSYSF